MTDVPVLPPQGPQILPPQGPGAMGPGPSPGVSVPVPPGVDPNLMLSPAEAQEIDIRDHLGLALADTAMELTKQVAMLSAQDAGQCKDMAQACLYLTEALVLVAPLESSGATAGPQGGPVPLAPKHMPPQASLHTAQQQATGRSA